MKKLWHNGFLFLLQDRGSKVVIVKLLECITEKFFFFF